jgi:Domain of unknown function (DUF4383)
MKLGQRYAQVTGIFFLLLAVLGFVPGLQHPINAVEMHDGVELQLGYLFGLFPINPVLNSVYAIAGILGLVAALGLGGARFYGRGMFLGFGLLAVFGLMTGFSTFFGLMPLFGNNVWLHLLIAGISFYFGFIDSPGLLEIASQPPEGAVEIKNY